MSITPINSGFSSAFDISKFNKIFEEEQERTRQLIEQQENDIIRQLNNYVYDKPLWHYNIVELFVVWKDAINDFINNGYSTTPIYLLCLIVTLELIILIIAVISLLWK